MINEEDILIIRAYFIEGKSTREISQRYGHCRRTVRNAIQDAVPRAHKLKKPRRSPVLGPYKERIDELLTESER